MAVSRRAFVKGALGTSGALLLGQRLGQTDPAGAVTLAQAAGLSTPLPPPSSSGIEHVVVVMMENRSFDHFLGWLPNARGRQGGLKYADPSGNLHPTYHQHQLNGCGFNDPDHSYNGGRIQYNGGKVNGFLTDTANDLYAIGYYTAADRPFMSALALNYTSCDHYFCSILGPTYPNRFFQHAAQTDRLDNGPASQTTTLPTIWDQLNQSGGPTGRYYYNDLPFLALWGSKYLSIADHYSQFLSDAAAGNLPNVAFVDPRFEDEGTGTSGDDHPRADIRAGDAFLSEVFHALATGPKWNSTVLIVNYDEWGGFFDHVVPPRITAGVPVGASPGSGVDKDLNSKGQVLAGFRVPCIIASPFTKGRPGSPSVAHGLYDHTSVLKLIEWRWRLKPLTQRDASSSITDPGNLATALRFGQPDATVPSVPNLPPFAFAGCSASAPAGSGGSTPARAASPSLPADNTWSALRASPLMAGWL